MVITKRYISLLVLAVALFAGCNPGIIDVPPVQVTDAARYFWKQELKSVIFLDSNGATANKFIPITLYFTPADTINSFTVRQFTNGITPDSFLATIGTEEISVRGLTHHTIISLPEGYEVKPVLTTINTTKAPKMEHIIAVAPQNIIASSSETGLYYSTDSGKNWSHSNLNSIGDAFITCFAQLHGIVYAGTVKGALLYSLDMGKSWKMGAEYSPKGIAALATSDSSDALFISAGDSIYYTSKPFSSRGTVLNPVLKDEILISLAVKNADTSFELVGSTGKGMYVFTKDRGWKTITNPQFGTIRSVITANNLFYCGSAIGIYSSEDGFSWKIRSSLPGAKLGYDQYSFSVIGINDVGNCRRMPEGSKEIILPSITGTKVNDITATYQNYFAAVDTGIFVLSANSSKWEPSSAGMSVQGTTVIESPGKVVLLRSATQDSSWETGTFVHNGISFTVTAKVIGHLDQIVMSDSAKYPDVIEVQYALDPLLPFLQIYYAKDFGPIIIRQLEGSKVTRKIYRSK